MEAVRAFIAIELPWSVKSSLSQLQDNLKKSEYGSVKWVDSESIHLTLKFLGNIDAGRIPALTSAISEAAKGVTPFHLEFDAPGAFPHLRAPRVVWVGLKGDTASLNTLKDNIERALIPLGFPPESQRFSPHLTLGRVRDRATPNERRLLGEAVSTLKAEVTCLFEVSSISLMRSRLTREGAIYSCLASVALGGG